MYVSYDIEYGAIVKVMVNTSRYTDIEYHKKDEHSLGFVFY